MSILTYNALRAAVSEKSSLSGSYSSRGVGFRECLERNIIQAFRLYRRTCPDRENVDSLLTTRQFYGRIVAPTHPIIVDIPSRIPAKIVVIIIIGSWALRRIMKIHIKTIRLTCLNRTLVSPEGLQR